MKFTDRLRELEAKATEGPWMREGFSRITGVTMNGIKRPEDAELITYLRNHAKEIINLVEAAEEAARCDEIGTVRQLRLRQALDALEKEQS